MAIRIVLYSHDSTGLGHIRRNLALAHALTAGLEHESVTGMLVAGRPEATRFAAPQAWDWLVMPGVRHTPAGYAPRALDLDMGSAASLRGSVFRSAMRSFRPDLLIIDRHLLGVSRELEPALQMLREEQPECRIVLGLREVLDAPDAAAAEWSALGGGTALRPLLDAVWVYGDPGIHNLTLDGQLPTALHDLVTHTGYLATGRVAGHRHDVEEPYVLTTVGGGSDGTDLACAAAAAPVPAGYRHLVVTGPQMSTSDRMRVTAQARPQTSVVRRVPDALALMQRAAAVICMAGYNTICEVMSTSSPALIAPRIQRRAEQQIRAKALSAVGAIEMLGPRQVDPATIGDWLSANVGRCCVHRDHIDLDGLLRVPALAAGLLAHDREHITAEGLRRGGERVAV